MDSLRAYNYRQSAILTGTLKPRERLVEKDLAGGLGMTGHPALDVRRVNDRGNE